MSIWDALNIIRPHRRHAVLDAVHYYRCREYMYLSHVGQTMCCAYCAKTAEPVVWRITIFDGIAAWRSRRSFRLCYTNVVCPRCAPHVRRNRSGRPGGCRTCNFTNNNFYVHIISTFVNVKWTLIVLSLWPLSFFFVIYRLFYSRPSRSGVREACRNRA